MATQRKQPATLAKTGKKRLPNSGSFKPGFDPRRNLNGRPQDLDELRILVRALGGQELTADGLTRITAKLLQMYASKNATDNANLLAYGWGKVRDESANEITVNVKQPFNADAARILFAPRPSGDNIPPGEDQGGGDGAEVGKNSSGRDSGA